MAARAVVATCASVLLIACGTTPNRRDESLHGPDDGHDLQRHGAGCPNGAADARRVRLHRPRARPKSIGGFRHIRRPARSARSTATGRRIGCRSPTTLFAVIAAAQRVSAETDGRLRHHRRRRSCGSGDSGPDGSQAAAPEMTAVARIRARCDGERGVLLARVPRTMPERAGAQGQDAARTRRQRHRARATRSIASADVSRGPGCRTTWWRSAAKCGPPVGAPTARPGASPSSARPGAAPGLRRSRTDRPRGFDVGQLS